MLDRFKKLQEAIRSQEGRYNLRQLMFEEEDYIRLSADMRIVGVSLINNQVKVEVNEAEAGYLGMSWLSDLAITKVVDTMVGYV